MIIPVHTSGFSPCAHDLLLRQLEVLKQEVGGHQTLALYLDLSSFTDLKLLILKDTLQTSAHMEVKHIQIWI